MNRPQKATSAAACQAGGLWRTGRAQRKKIFLLCSVCSFVAKVFCLLSSAHQAKGEGGGGLNSRKSLISKKVSDISDDFLENR
jgi:hypothetical protein